MSIYIFFFKWVHNYQQQLQAYPVIRFKQTQYWKIASSLQPHAFFLSLCFYSTCLLNCCLSTLSYIRNEVAIFNLLDAIAHEQKINTIFSPWKLKLKLISFHFYERTYTHSAFEIIALDEDLLCQPHNDNASDNNDNNIPLKQSYERKE